VPKSSSASFPSFPRIDCVIYHSVAQMPSPLHREAAFIEPTEYLAVWELPSGAEWYTTRSSYGYRAIAIQCQGKEELA
jgi:hypothetical protein